MAKKKQEQQEQSQDEHVMAILDKRTNKTAVVSKMNEQDGSLEIVPPDKKEQWQLPQTGPYLTAGTLLHQFQEPVRQSHEFQFFPRTTCPFGKDTECRSPDPERGRPRSGRQKAGGEQRTQR